MDFLGGRYHKYNFCNNQQERKFICANRRGILGNCDGFVRLTLSPTGLTNLNGPLIDYEAHAKCCEFFKTNARLEARFKNGPTVANKAPAKKVVDCSSSSESTDVEDDKEVKVAGTQNVEGDESEKDAGEQHVEDGQKVAGKHVDGECSKTEFDEDYGSLLNQNLFVLEVTLNKLNEIAPFVTAKSIFKDKMLSCKRNLENLLKIFDLAGSNDKNSIANAVPTNSTGSSSDRADGQAGLTRRGLKRKKSIHSNAYFAKRNYEKVINKRLAARKKEPVEDEKAVVTRASIPFEDIVQFGNNKLGHFKIPKKTDE